MRGGRGVGDGDGDKVGKGEGGDYTWVPNNVTVISEAFVLHQRMEKAKCSKCWKLTKFVS
jgi:hypothetical protein